MTNTYGNDPTILEHLRSLPSTLGKEKPAWTSCTQRDLKRPAGEDEIEWQLRMASRHTPAGWAAMASCVPPWCLRNGWSRLSEVPYPDYTPDDRYWIVALDRLTETIYAHVCALREQNESLQDIGPVLYTAGYALRLIQDIVEDAYFRGRYGHPITPLLKAHEVPAWTWGPKDSLAFVERLHAPESAVRKSSFFRDTSEPFYTLYGKDRLFRD